MPGAGAAMWCSFVSSRGIGRGSAIADLVGGLTKETHQLLYLITSIASAIAS